MKVMITMSNQQLYYVTVKQAIEQCSEKENCTLIIDGSYLDEFLSKGKGIIKKCINQLIIINENIDIAFAQLKRINVLLVAAESIEEAIRISIFGKELSSDVFCIVKENEGKVVRIIKGLEE